MKITQLFKIYWPDNGGGIAKVMEDIADGFRDCEQEIIVCQDSRKKKSADDTYKGIVVRRCRQLFELVSTPVSLQFLWDVWKRTKDSDLVISHFPYPMADLAAALKINRVEFTGIVSEEEKMQRIKACDFLVLPSISRAEAFAVVQLEAMAFGKPVINTALRSGVPDVSIDRITGITVKPGSVKELAQAMDKLSGDESLRKKYGKNALLRVQKKYTQQIIVEKYKKIFQQLGADYEDCV